MTTFQAITREKKKNKTTKHCNNASFSIPDVCLWIIVGGYGANILAYTSLNWGRKDVCGLKRFMAECLSETFYMGIPVAATSSQITYSIMDYGG